MVCLHYILILITVMMTLSSLYWCQTGNVKSNAKFIWECFSIRCRNVYYGINDPWPWKDGVSRTI